MVETSLSLKSVWEAKSVIGVVDSAMGRLQIHVFYNAFVHVKGGYQHEASLTADPLWELQIHVFYNAFVHVKGGYQHEASLTADPLWELQIL